MSVNDSPKPSLASPSSVLLPLGLRSRRGSLASLTGSSQIDKEQLAQALDKIHSSASQSDQLTTFNEFASPPSSSTGLEGKRATGDLMQSGISGLYNRFRGVVSGSRERSERSPSKASFDEGGQVTGLSGAYNAETPRPSSKYTESALTRSDSGLTSSPVVVSFPSSRLQSPSVVSSASFPAEVHPPTCRASKASSISIAGQTPLSSSSARPSIGPMTKATASTVAIPTVAQINVDAFKESELLPRSKTSIASPTTEATASKEALNVAHQRIDSMNSGGHQASSRAYHRDVDVESDDRSQYTDALSSRSNKAERESLGNGDGTTDGNNSPSKSSKSASAAMSSLHQSENDRQLPRLVLPDSVKSPVVADQLMQPPSSRYQPSRASSTDRSTAEASPVTISAHNSIRHGSFSAENNRSGSSLHLHIPGTTTNEGAPEVVNARLEQMRKQVLSKEFWMADEICKECFFCGDAFSAFRRKHHCRTCGCIFDSKCTSRISGERFGVQGSLRICKTCLDIINRRHDSSDSDISHDEAAPHESHLHPRHLKLDTKQAISIDSTDKNDIDYSMPVSTPMMAIPATRRIGESTNRRSAVLEIDAPQLSRPSSSRSLKAQSGQRPISSHKRHHSKHQFLGRFKSSNVDERAPFHHDAAEELRKKRLPAFHDDNIIDPDLAEYMSDEASSGDEQMSIFSTINETMMANFSVDNERSNLGSFLPTGKKLRSRAGGQSLSGINFTNRIIEEGNGSGAVAPSSKPIRRRNLSTASNNIHFSRPSPRQTKPNNLIRNNKVDEEVFSGTEPPSGASSPSPAPATMVRSMSMTDSRAPALELNNASLQHVRNLLHQLLQDAQIPNVAMWIKALIPILLRCTDDVNPDVRRGDDIDIRHYVKLKKIPGGRPGDTSYVSGVVFTKNLALKSMPRTLSNPRIVIVSFPIEYQRHQQQLLSLEPVIAQEKEFLKNMVNRIASLRPQLVLVQKHISGLALQLLAEANIAVAYNVKQSVIEAVSRCAQTEIISSIDMVALKPVHVGKSAGFDVKTYVHGDIVNKKKTCIYISGCPKELGCTIVLRGANMKTLTKMKRITEFMVYVVYNLKLETCLMRDEFVLIPSTMENGGSASPSKQALPELTQASSDLQTTQSTADSAIEDKMQALTQSSRKSQEAQQHIVDNNVDSTPPTSASEPNLSQNSEEQSQQLQISGILERPKAISAHVSHTHTPGDELVPEDVPMPTYYSDMVAKHQTKILSASPFVKFSPPHLLMRSREQERRLVYLKRLRDQDSFEEPADSEKAKPQRFQLIKPEMVHETVRGAPRQIMEVLHAVHDAEYDKALHNYQTQTRQWENYIQGNLNLFDPFAHQNIVVLYTVVCTTTTVPCAGPELLALGFYNEHEASRDFDPDCTLGQYVEDLCLGVDTVCTSNGCERRMSEHHRTYVHGEARITVFIEKSPCKIKGLHDSILMWSYCKVCQKETQVMPMSESTWKYSFGKYLELSFWSNELRLRAGFCPHDLHRDHLRYFSYRNVAMRIHYDPIDLLEIIVPRTRITWKVDNDLKLKNDQFTKSEERWNRFMLSVKSRIKGINVESVESEKLAACKAEIERLTKKAQDEHASLLRKLQDKYMRSKYYEIIPLNRAVRAMQEKVVEWDAAFADFDGNYFPSEKDIRKQAAVQLKKMFMDRDGSTASLVSADTTETASDPDEKSPSVSLELTPNTASMSSETTQDVLTSVVEETSPTDETPLPNVLIANKDSIHSELGRGEIQPLDLAVPSKLERESSSVHSTKNNAIDSVPVDESVVGTSKASDCQISPTDSGATPSDPDATPRRFGQSSTQDYFESTSISGPSEPATPRRQGSTSSPPLTRTQSHPTGIPRRYQPITNKSYSSRDPRSAFAQKEVVIVPGEAQQSPEEQGAKAEKKFSDRLGLKTINRKAGHSLIPRSVRDKRKESKVTTLAKHFEQLSREFEKERLRDRKQRNAKDTRSRAFPKASSKPIVQVYKDVNEAVAEKGHIDDDMNNVKSTMRTENSLGVVEGLANLMKDKASAEHQVPHSPTGTTATAEETTTEAETDDNQRTASQTASDDEGANSDIDSSLLDDIHIPDTDEIANSLGMSTPSVDSSLDIPKHEKSSLMKMLTNFWAERSASGWTQLEYPMNVQDHIFSDSDVIVREDEPSSLIAFALNSEDYKSKLSNIRMQGSLNQNNGSGMEKPMSEQGDYEVNQAEVETSLLRATGTHMKYQFAEGSAKMHCKIFYAEQFDAVRRKCGVSERIVESLSRCMKWDSKGGKTKSVFLKTLDDRLILKSLSPIETQAFLRFAPAYFSIMSEILFHDLPSVIAKMLGFYTIVIKNPVTNIEIKLDFLLMENLFYDRAPTRIFDLKGSMRNRKIQSTGEQNEVLLDENMVEFIYESPLFAREHSKKLLRASVWNDTLFLARQNVMDYSLMVAVDEARRELVVGIIDCIRTYTWDKKLESWIKDRGFAGGGRNRPTVTSPKEYKTRFREAMARYVLLAPNSWHQFASQLQQQQQHLQQLTNSQGEDREAEVDIQ